MAPQRQTNFARGAKRGGGVRREERGGHRGKSNLGGGGGLQEWEHVGEDEDMERVMRRMQAFDAPSDEEDDEEEDGESGGSEGRVQPRYSDAADDDDEEEEADSPGSSDDEEQDSDSEDQDDEDDSGESEGEADEKELARIRRELADVPFDQLMEIQQKVGMKKFHANFRGMKASGDADPENSGEESDRKKTASGKSKKSAGPEEKGSKKLVRPPRRADKNMPVEVTSKRAVTRKRDVIELPKKKTRDPRFDPLAGKLNEGLFDSSYGFLRDYEQSEIEMLRKQIVTEKNPEKKEILQQTLTSMTSRMQARKNKDKRKELVKEWKKKESALVQQGKKPWQLKQSDIKKMELVEKYKSMKGKDVEKLLEKRRKKNATKERRFMPYNRRSAA
ncbi:hypothetical protein PhCBS80983_g05633 [Powellomyces hirtus]|uniref:rRNA biogenesis protein RRP36 n=1 Tax=Powellomyces hirtus TaxID=109895 RepID=A0A507DTI1_9FUNG|nr:hypothetical protein PhCBS80983_g05633 [Powellomyces hirtus]